MFASEMKILTLTTAANVTAVKSNHLQSNYNNSNTSCDNASNQKSQNLNKLKYLSTNKYHSNNSSSSSSSSSNNNNNKTSKKHHHSNNNNNNNNNNTYSNSNNNNSTSSLNRKKYHQQQQKQSVNSYDNSDNDYNSSSNNNNTTTTTQTTSTVGDFILQPKMVDTINNNCNRNYNNYNVADDVDYLTIFNNNNSCTPTIVINNDYNNESSSIPQKASQDQQELDRKKQFLNETHTKLLPTTTVPAINGKNKQMPGNGYWTNFNKQQAGAKSKQSQNSTTCNNSTSTNYQDFALPRNKGNNKKNKSYFKNLDNKNKQQTQHKQQQPLHDSYSAHKKKYFGNNNIFSVKDGSNKSAKTLSVEQFLCNTIAASSNTTVAMTTALVAPVTDNASTPTNTSASNTPKNSPRSQTNVTISTPITTSATDLQPSPASVDDGSSESAATSEIVSNSTSTTTPNAATSTATTKAQKTVVQNAYSLDFLHSVGAQMTSGGDSSSSTNTQNLPPINYNTNTQNIAVSPTRSTNYSFNSTSQRQNRYLSASQGNQYHSNHYQHGYHHHQPQQLTIASFMQKELTESFSLGNNNSNINSYEQPHSSGQQQPRYHNYYNQYQHRNQRYHQQQQQNPQQSQQSQQQNQQNHSNYSSAPHGYNNVGDSAAGGSDSNGGNGQSYQNNYHQSGSNQSQQHSRHHQQSNVNQTQSQQQQHHYQNQSKKNIFSCSSTSSCSSSSSSSISSISSQASATSALQRQQQGDKNSSSTATLNFAIETLPSKSHYSSFNRGQKGHHSHHHHHNSTHQHHHQQQQLQQQHNASNTPSTPQHQNFYNLTYVATDSKAVLPATIAATASNTIPNPRGRSPSPALLMNNSHHHHQQQQYQSNSNRYFHQQVASFNKKPQQNFHNNHQKLLTASATPPPLLPPPSSATPCCSQVDEATTCTVAAIATAWKDSQLSSVASSSATKSIIAGSDYDSDSAISTHSTTAGSTTSVETQKQQNTQEKPLQGQNYTEVKPTSLSSSSSSASSTTSISSAHENVAPVKLVQNNVDFGYAFPLQNQQFPPQFSNHQQQQQQQQPHLQNGVVSFLNLPTGSNNYASVNVNAEGIALAQLHQPQHPSQQQQQPQPIYFNSGEQPNLAGPQVADSSGYWNQSANSLQNASLLYPPTSTGPPSCGSSTASLSPCLLDEREQVATENQGIQFKRNQSSSSTAQRNSQMNASGGIRLRGRSQQHHQQQNQHGLYYSSSSHHLRSSSSSSMTDFFSHTPPDRFLARAHLIEAKEMPSDLLNNTKWDTLSQGIWDKFVISQQTEETYKQKMRLWRYLYIFIKNTYPRYGLYLVGSTISGFGADTSDVDMCLVSRSPANMEPRQEALISLTNLRDCLAKLDEFENFNLIEAKVPILRFRDRVHQIEVDLNYNNCVGIKNTHLLYCYSQLDWRLRPLVLVTKLWAQFHNINNAKNMTISSYSLVLMVIHFLQYAVSPSVLPCLHDMYPDKFQLLRSNDFGYVDMNESMGTHESKNIQTVGELFLNFLEYYSCFDYTQFAISVRTGGLMPINVCRQVKSLKNDFHQWKELCIEEPFELTNTARSVYDFETFERVKAVFVASWRVLQESLDVNAVFSPIMIAPQTSTMFMENSTTNLTPATTYMKTLADVETMGIQLCDANAEGPHQIDERIEKEMIYSTDNNSNNSNNISNVASNISSSSDINNTDSNNNSDNNNNNSTNNSEISSNNNNNTPNNIGPNVLTSLIS